MEGTYTIRSADKECGSVQVVRQGLYYLFRCHCQLHSQVLIRLRIQCGASETDLGILVPGNNGFYLTKKLPIKNFGPGKPIFSLFVKGKDTPSRFIPIYPEEPFAYIYRLKNSFLTVQNGQTGIMI